MDIYSARDAYTILLRRMNASNLLKQWHYNTEVAQWYNPASKYWKYARIEQPIILNDDGNEVDPQVIRNECWDRLVKESNINLRLEDKAASILLAALKGNHTRNIFRLRDKLNYI